MALKNSQDYMWGSEKYRQIYLVPLVLLIVFIGLLASGRGFYIKEKENTKEFILQELRTIGTFKSSQLSQWYVDKVSDAEFFSNNIPYTQYVKQISEGDFSMESELRNSLFQIITDNRYENILLLDTLGNYIYSILPEKPLIDGVTKNFALKSISTGEVLVTDLYYCGTHQKIHFDTMAPVKDSNNKVIALMVFRVDPYTNLYRLMQDLPITSKTAETVLVNRNNDTVRFLNELRLSDNSKLGITYTIKDADVPAVRAAFGETGTFEGYDYADRKVLGVSFSISETPWYMVVKIESQEVFKDFNRNTALIIISVFLCIALFLTLLVLVYRNRQKRVAEELLEKKTALYRSQEELGVTLYCIGDGVISTNEKGLINRLNHVAEKLTGWNEKEALGREIGEVFRIINEDTAESEKNPIDKVISERVIVGLANDTTLLSKDGTEVQIDGSGAPIKDSYGNLLGVIMVFSDQTAERLRRRIIDIRLKAFEYSFHNPIDKTLTLILDEIVLLLKSRVGILHFHLPDQEALSLKAWSTNTKDTYLSSEDGQLIFSLKEGGLLADSVKKKTPIINNNGSLTYDLGIPGTNAKLSRVLIMPVVRKNTVVAVIVLADKPTDYTENDINNLNFLADVLWEIAEHKINETRLLESEKRFVRLYERAPLGYQSLDENGFFLDVNQAWCDTLGYTKEEVIGSWFGDYLVPEQVGLFKSNFPKFKQRGETRVEFSMIHKSGEIRTIVFEGRVSTKDNGQFDQTHCILIDVTEQRDKEKTIKENERQLSSIIGNLPGFVYRCKYDPEWTMLYISEKLTKITGYLPEDILFNKKFFFNDITVEEFRDGIYRKWEEVLVNKSMFKHEYQLITADKSIIWVYEQGNVIYDNNGEILFLEGYIEDITYRKKAEEQLQWSEELNRLIKDFSMDAIMLTRIDGSILSANKAACEMFGMSEEEICSVGRDGVVDIDDPRLYELLSIRKQYGYARGELNFRRGDGSLFPVEVTSSLFRNSKDEEFSSMIIRDISERKTIEREMIKAKEKAIESDRLKSAFLANVSHEIRTPMNGIIGFLDLLSEPGLDSEQQSLYIEIVNQSGERLLNTINDIIEISKIESGEKDIKETECSLEKSMEYQYDFFKPQTDKKGIALAIEKQIGGKVMIDKFKLDGILTNLVKNSIKFTDKGSILIGNYVDDNKLVFYVKDTGRGIPADKLVAIFERFTQADTNLSRSYEGSGLGLSIAKAYVELMGGKIWVESELGKGSTFYFSVPYKPTEQTTK